MVGFGSFLKDYLEFNNISQSELKVLNNIDNLINFFKGKIFKQIIFSTTKNKLSLWFINENN